MTTENKTQEKEPIKEKKRPIDIARENLKLLSLEVADLVEDGTFFTINDAIVETLYKDETHKEFKSYRQWKKEGCQVKKGEKAFLLWAKPKQIQKPITDGTAKEELEEMLKFFPIAYLFSNAQVDEIDGEAEQNKEKPTTNKNQEQNSKTENNPKEKTKISLEPLEY
jgi:hypothetical protein